VVIAFTRESIGSTPDSSRSGIERGSVSSVTLPRRRERRETEPWPSESIDEACSSSPSILALGETYYCTYLPSQILRRARVGAEGVHGWDERAGKERTGWLLVVSRTPSWMTSGGPLKITEPGRRRYSVFACHCTQ
jgi:hypothetical protein